MATLKEIRMEKKMTQLEVAKLVGISLRSYKSYENDESKIGTIKYKYILEQLNKINYVDEETGILTIEDIIEKCTKVLEKYDIRFCYLFGSYAKGYASASSDIDLMLSTSLTGLNYYQMVEELRSVLHKRVDILDVKQLVNNATLLEDILKDGIKIYG
ncbi:MAG: helix-turn-helix domain-containing protein [Erysipelotrichaceae bacterium]|nr:helix-turn-helix domain-containing protein [Erysipelotrichaceae bacterium]MDY5252800.1 helix-turn-helix domain-containing protein [Erysipelotrichaceae bacterium]